MQVVGRTYIYTALGMYVCTSVVGRYLFSRTAMYLRFGRRLRHNPSWYLLHKITDEDVVNVYNTAEYILIIIGCCVFKKNKDSGNFVSSIRLTSKQFSLSLGRGST